MATPNPYQESSAADHELVEFARSHGAELKGIGISAGVDGERGLVAERKVLPKETVLFVPASLVITDEDAMALPTIRALLASAAAVHLQVRERPELQLMLFLVVDRTRVDDEADGVEPAGAAAPPARPSLSPHYAAMPQSYAELPMAWSDEALECRPGIDPQTRTTHIDLLLTRAVRAP